MNKPTIVYEFRGYIERISSKGRGRWLPGYSENGEFGQCYPWHTKRECQSMAKIKGHRAIFSHSDN